MVLIGEAPGRTNLPDPLTGESGASGRLRSMLGLTLQAWRRIDRANLIPYYPERWPTDVARRQAVNLTPLLRSRDVVVLGRRVARAFWRARNRGRR